MSTQPKPTPIQSDDVKWLAITIRRGLLVIVKAIEQRYEMDQDKGQKAA
jgi:hypothetical protein